MPRIGSTAAPAGCDADAVHDGAGRFIGHVAPAPRPQQQLFAAGRATAAAAGSSRATISAAAVRRMAMNRSTYRGSRLSTTIAAASISSSENTMIPRARSSAAVTPSPGILLPRKLPS